MMTSPKRVARLAGVFYLLMALGSGFAELYVRSRLIESGDAAATAGISASADTVTRSCRRSRTHSPASLRSDS